MMAFSLHYQLKAGGIADPPRAISPAIQAFHSWPYWLTHVCSTTHEQVEDASNSFVICVLPTGVPSAGKAIIDAMKAAHITGLDPGCSLWIQPGGLR
jgi:hypothetical protein